MLRNSNHSFLTSLRSASQTIHFSDDEALRISDHEFLRQRAFYLRSWACAWQTTSANVSETHLFNEPHIKGEEQDCSSAVALLDSAVLSGETVPRISADNERFYQDISSGSENFDLVMWESFHQLNRFLVSVISEIVIARGKNNRLKKMFAKVYPPELDKYSPSNIPGIASNMTENVNK